MITTERLILRAWRAADIAPWAVMNADPEVRRHLGPPLTTEEAESSIHRFQSGLERNGYGFWALEVRASGSFIGCTGLGVVSQGAPSLGVELGWRLAPFAWGHGYATEAALAAMQFGFAIVGLPEIVAVTTRTNLRSQAVMQRIGMTHDPAEDFDDLSVEQDTLRRLVVYRKRREDTC